MAYHQKLIKIFLSFVIAISPVLFINSANAAIGGWSLSNPVARGASAVYDATKTVLINGKNTIKKSTVTITPAATDVAKVLARTGVTLALTVAVEQLLGGVDWVLDPANNQILYEDPKNPATNPDPTKQYLYQCLNNGTPMATFYYSPVSACSALLNSIVNKKNDNTGRWLYTVTGSATCGASSCSIPYHFTDYRTSPATEVDAVQSTGFKRTLNPIYDPQAQPNNDKKSLPLEAVAAQVISNAESEADQDRKAAAQSVTMAAAADVVEAAESDSTKARPIATQLDQAASTPTTETSTGTATQTKTDPATGEAVTETTDLALAFPTFCGWAPLVCEAAQTVISFPTTLTNWWDTANTKATEWSLAITEAWADVQEIFESSEQTDTELEIPEIEQETTDTNISFDDSCPAAITLANFSWHGFSQNWQVDFTDFCDSLRTFVKPIVIAMGSFTAVLIVAGVRSDE